MQTVLVSGGGGYVGNVLVRRLLNLACKVRVMDNFHKGQCDALLSVANNKNFEFQYGDVTVESDCDKAVDGVDGIIHLAGIVGFPACKRQPALSYAVNVDGCKNILRARSKTKKNIPIVYASTGSVYGKVEGICRESSPINYQSIYGEHKYLGEQAIVNEENSVALRFATGFGCSPCMRVNLLVNDLVYQAITNRCLTIFEADARRTFIHVEDMAIAFTSALFKLKYGELSHKVYNAGFDELNKTKREIAELIREKTGCLVTYADIGKDLDARDYAVDYSLFKKEIISSPTKTIEVGIDELIKATPILQIRHNYE